MRMYGFLKEPYMCNKKDTVYKVMVHVIKGQGVAVYLYIHKDAMFCSFDHFYTELEDALEDWEEELDEQGWIEIDAEYKIYYIPMKYGITEIKKILHHVSDNVYKIKKDTEMGNLFVAGRLYQVIPTIKWLMEENILFHVTPENPLERYAYWKECRYAYCFFGKLK